MTVRPSHFPENYDLIEQRKQRDKKNKDKLIETKQSELRDNLERCREDKVKYHINRYLEQIIYLLNL